MTGTVTLDGSFLATMTGVRLAIRREPAGVATRVGRADAAVVLGPYGWEVSGGLGLDLADPAQAALFDALLAVDPPAMAVTVEIAGVTLSGDAKPSGLELSEQGDSVVGAVTLSGAGALTRG